jgi:predicted nucleic acid-binding Zn ribbon protein
MPPSRPTHCVVCGRPLEQKQRGRIRYYCSTACRSKAYRLRKKRSQPANKTPSNGRKVEVVYCPEGLFPHGTFSWSDFQTSLGAWPTGMQVKYQGQYYEVQATRLQPISAESVKKV